MKKKRASIFIAVLMVIQFTVALMPASAAITRSNLTNPSRIADLFTDISAAPNDDITIVLKADIDMSAYGVFETPATNGKITFTGNGHVIKNLKTTRGFFATISEGSSITGLALYNCEVVDLAASSADGHGALAGSMTGGTVSNCIVTGEIAVNGVDNIGGLVGQMSGGSVTDCAAACDITSDGGYVGGLIGNISGGTVTQSYSAGSIDNDSVDYIGGLFGYSTVAPENSYTVTHIKNAYADTFGIL